MKQFFKMVFAVLCALIIFTALCSILSLFFLVSLTAVGSSTSSLPKSGGLSLDMSGFALGEVSTDSNLDVISLVQGSGMKTIGLWDAVQAVNTAAEDPAIKFIYIKADELLAASSGLAHIEELRQALERFRSSGKPIVAYTEYPTTGSYWLISVSDKIYMSANKGCASQITGVGTSLLFLKDALDKLGVNVQLIRHGKYKSAGEMYVRSEASAENMQMNREMISSIWDAVATETAESRGLTKEDLSGMIDGLELGSAQDMLDKGLVDGLVTKEEMDEKLMTLAGVSRLKDVKLIPLPDYIDARFGDKIPVSKKKIAVIYADGNIVEGDGTRNIAGDRFVREIDKVKADSTVKAVVLRVNSPGGTVLAADKIKTEIDLLRKVKPVIASYGDYAASGGYWISSSCDKVYSDKTTLTGSIGVFSMVPDFSKSVKNLLHVNVTFIGSSKHSDMYSCMRPLDEAELQYIQKEIEEVYDSFTGVVAAGRGLDQGYVDGIAQGRVWTGSEALGIGLVDEIGTLEDAIHYAVLATGSTDSDLDGWDVVAYPKQPTALEQLIEAFGLGGEQVTVFKGTPLEDIELAFKHWDWNSSEHIYARMPYEYEFVY